MLLILRGEGYKKCIFFVQNVGEVLNLADGRAIRIETQHSNFQLVTNNQYKYERVVQIVGFIRGITPRFC